MVRYWDKGVEGGYGLGLSGEAGGGGGGGGDGGGRWGQGDRWELEEGGDRGGTRWGTGGTEKFLPSRFGLAAS